MAGSEITVFGTLSYNFHFDRWEIDSPLAFIDFKRFTAGVDLINSLVKAQQLLENEKTKYLLCTVAGGILLLFCAIKAWKQYGRTIRARFEKF